MPSSSNSSPSDIAFTEAVKAVQARKGSRPAYARMEATSPWPSRITPELQDFIEDQTSVFLATASADGQPYIQHRGGPKGFLKVLDDETIGFVDFSGNRQFISIGNLSENPRVQLFLIDYAQRQRVKIWGTATVIEGDSALAAGLMPPDYPAKSEQVILISVKTWNANCPKHIPQRLEATDFAETLAQRDRRIAALELELQALRKGFVAPIV